MGIAWVGWLQPRGSWLEPLWCAAQVVLGAERTLRAFRPAVYFEAERPAGAAGSAGHGARAAAALITVTGRIRGHASP